MMDRPQSQSSASHGSVGNGPTYDEDYAGWATEQAALLKAGRFDALDVANLVEELEDVGKSEAHRLRSALTIILAHLLKWDHQPGRRSRSWAGSIRIQRVHAQRTLKENPSLKPRVPHIIEEAYEIARLEAAEETGIEEDVFPVDCPYDWDAIMSRAHDLADPQT
jgi:Domain of unknown function DUF29